MKKTLSILFSVLICTATIFAQNSVTLTFTCQATNGGYLQPDSITIENLTRNWVETIYYPDTVYTLNVGTGVSNHPDDNGIKVMPNPFDGTTRVNIQSPKMENVKMTLTDMSGRVCAEYSGLLQEGGNLFNITLTTPQTYLLSVQTSSGIRSLKMENTGCAGANRIAYEGATGGNMPMVQLKSNSNHSFQLGDEMRYQGYATNLGAVVQSNPVTHAQNTDELIVLVFPDWSSSDNDGLPCPGAPTVTDIDGNVYNTVQIGNQCWMHENLRTTKYADGSSIPSSVNLGSAVDPYYYDYSSSAIPIAERGYLYNWSAAMHGAVNSNALPIGIQGICPNGWHLPSYTEWMQLKDYVSSRSEYRCNGGAPRIAKALAATSWWDDYPNHNCTPGDQSVYPNNATNFSAVPAGQFVYYLDFDFGNGFDATSYATGFWSATKSEDYDEQAYTFTLSYTSATVELDDGYSTLFGNSVRCLRGESAPPVTDPTVTTSAVSNVSETSAMLNGYITNPDNITITSQGFEWKATNGGVYTQVGANGTSMTYLLTGLTPNNSYTYRAFISFGGMTVYGDELTFTTLSPCPGTPTVMDHEGNVYNTVQIGNQCWTRENMRCTTSPSTGTYLIPSTNAGTTYAGKQARWYDNDSTTYAPLNYGLLYNWNAAVDTFNTAYDETAWVTDPAMEVNVAFAGNRRGICPEGWHIPNDAEWTLLTNYLGSQGQYQCDNDSTYTAKSLAAAAGWDNSTNICAVGNDQSSNNATGFCALPAGHFKTWSYDNFGKSAYFWSSGPTYVYFSYYSATVHISTNIVNSHYQYKKDCYSVRCLRD